MDKGKKSKVEISVIVTSYNVERYIVRAIMSALDQEGVSLEVIWVDDVSSDATWETGSAIEDVRLKRLRMPVNAGPGATRNTAIQAASGEWIAVLDGDDYLLPGRLARLVLLARKAQADIVVDNLRVHREAESVYMPMFRLSDFPASFSLDLARFILGNQKFLGGFTLGYLKPVFSTRFLRDHALSYDPELRIGEDYIFLARALAQGAVCLIDPQEGYCYTVRAGSISHRLSAGDVERIISADRKFLSGYPLPAAALNAQKQREKSLRKAYAFVQVTEAIKSRNIPAAVKAIMACPAALAHFAGPIRVRQQRLLKRLLFKKTPLRQESVS